MTMDRTNERINWTNQVLSRSDIQLQRASSDASFRSYWRTTNGTPQQIVMDAPVPQENIQPWLEIGRHLANAGIRTPRVYASSTERGFALIEDFGQQTLLGQLNENTVDFFYDKAMAMALDMAVNVDARHLPIYDAHKLYDEMALVIPWFLQQYSGIDVNTQQHDTLQKAFQMLTENALAQPQCFVHRDFHSRNLMVLENHELGVIDFQDAVLGPITYDLVSLLRDCYIRWDEDHIHQWCHAYWEKLQAHRLLETDISYPKFKRWFDLMGMQRHIKVLGIFSRLAIRDRKPDYLDDLPRVLDYIQYTGNRYPELKAVTALLLTTAENGADAAKER